MKSSPRPTGSKSSRQAVGMRSLMRRRARCTRDLAPRPGWVASSGRTRPGPFPADAQLDLKQARLRLRDCCQAITVLKVFEKSVMQLVIHIAFGRRTR